MDLGSVIAGVAGIISGLTPGVLPGNPFARFAIESPAGLDETAALTVRAFDVAPVGAPFEGPGISASGAPGTLRQELAVRVCYWRGGFQSTPAHANAIAKDAGQMIGALRNPANWASFATNLFPDGSRLGRAEMFDDGGSSIGAILELRVIAEWEV